MSTFEPYEENPSESSSLNDWHSKLYGNKGYSESRSQAKKKGALMSMSKSTREVSMQDVQQAWYSSSRVDRTINTYLMYLDITLRDLSNALRDNNDQLVAILYENLSDIRGALIRCEYYNMMDKAHVD